MLIANYGVISMSEGSREEYEQLKQVVEAQSERIQQLESELKEERETRARADAEERKRLHEVEERLDSLEEGGSRDPNAHPQADENTLQKPETPLEQTAALPQEIIDQESPNVRRAVFIASDVFDYTRKVPAGRAIRSGELRKVLKAGTDSTGHTQTVSRVMDVLDDMGKDEVKVVKRRGEKRVIFSEEGAQRLAQLTGDGKSHRVVIENQARV